VSNLLGAPLFTSNLSDASKDTTRLAPGKHLFVVTVPGRFLAPGTYSLHVGLHRPNVEVFDAHDGILKFKIEEAGSEMWRFHGRQYGNILVQFPWRHEQGDY
jgi:lipopolysaccharide transport system ATP-binding protein